MRYQKTESIGNIIWSLRARRAKQSQNKDCFVVALLLLAMTIFFAISFLQADRIDAQAKKDKIIILGFDGADFDLTKRWLNEGELPNLKKLKGQGTFSRLLSTNPADSPVSWS